MAGAAIPGRLTSEGLRWRLGRLVELRRETPTACTLVLDVPGWPGHRAGQHVDVRLTAEDGYQAQRSYSIASPPEAGALELTVERLDDGEVSPYLADELREGDDLELRGPIGGWFVWEVADGGPVLLVAGGSGVVPLAAMARHRLRAGAAVPMHLVLSARTRADLIYGDELQALADRDDGFRLTVTLTREQDPGWTGRTGRIDAALLAEQGWPPDASPRIFVCGPTGLVEAAAGFLVDLGHDPQAVRTERFGPTGS